MSDTDVRYIIDRELVSAEIARSRETLAQGRWRWFRRTFFYIASPLYLMTIALQWQRVATLTSQTAATQAALLLLPGLLAAAIAWSAMRVLFNRRALDVDTQVKEIADSLRSVAGYGWMKRALRTGVAIGLAIGIPMGALMAVLWTPGRLPVSNRWLMIPAFTALTLLWIVPGTFVFRWLSLVGLRRFVKAVPATTEAQRTSA